MIIWSQRHGIIAYMAADLTTILVATGNEGKVRELAGLLREVPVTLRSLADFPSIREVDETGSTFLENACLKAADYSVQTGLPALADDSGLEVKGLGGAPGVHSARFAGESTTYAEKMDELLSQLEKNGSTDRRARFACSMVLSDADGRIITTSEGFCEGTLAESPRGSNGFGYDPIFIPDGYELTFGQLPDSVKSSLSHRARASAGIIRYLLDFIVV